MSVISKRTLGGTGLQTTIIGFGALEIGRDWGVGSAQERRRPDEARIARARERGIGVLIRSGLAGGWLTSRALRMSRIERPAGVTTVFDLCNGDAELVTSLALQFLARNEGVSSILIGSKSRENIETAIRLVSSPLEAGLLDHAVELTRYSGKP